MRSDVARRGALYLLRPQQFGHAPALGRRVQSQDGIDERFLSRFGHRVARELAELFDDLTPVANDCSLPRGASRVSVSTMPSRK